MALSATRILTPPRSRPALRRTLLYLALAVSSTTLGVQLYTLSDPHRTRPDDFISSWAAGRLLVRGDDPYDPVQVLAVQRTANWTKDVPYRVWYPPWALPILGAFGLLPYVTGRFFWYLLNLGACVLAADALWRWFRGPPRLRALSWPLLFTFWPAVIAIRTGQISALVLVGVVGFLHYAERRRWLAAGACLPLAAIKPQLLHLFWIAVLLWVVQERRWRVLAGAAATTTALVLAATWADPRVVPQFLHMATYDTPTAPASTLGTVLRLAIGHATGRDHFWLQFVPPLLSLAWFLPYWSRHRHGWEWRDHVSIVLVVSLVTTAYGWIYDQIVFLVPAMAIATAIARSADLARHRGTLLGYAVINAGILAMNVAGAKAFAYVWVPIAFAVWWWKSAPALRETWRAPATMTAPALHASAAPTGPPPASRRTANDLSRPVLVALLLAIMFVLSLSDHADPDLWGHVRYGSDLLATGRLPTFATYAFTASDHVWINHEWASELLFAAIARIGGGSGLTAFKLALGLSVFAPIVMLGRHRGARVAVLAATMLLAAVNVSPGWSVRPQIFSYAAFAVMVTLLDRAYRGGRWRALWPIPPLFVCWMNLHAGVVAGFAVLTTYVASEALETFVRKRPDAARQSVRGALVVAAAALSVYCTPYGSAYPPWLAHAISLPRPAITEWQPIQASDPRFVPLVALVAWIVVGWIGSRRSRPLAQTLVLLVVGWQACLHVRHAPFLAILAALWLPRHAQSFADRWRPTRAATSSTSAPAAIRWAAWGACALLLGAVAMRIRPPAVDRGAYPVDAFAYMREHRLTGRLIAHFDWAQYALASFAPATSVQFDGRFETAYPQDVADAHFDFVLGGERATKADSTSILRAGDPELVLVSRRYRHPTALMQRQADWVLLYQDAVAQLWGLRRKYDETTSRDYLPVSVRSVSEQMQRGLSPWPALP